MASVWIEPRRSGRDKTYLVCWRSKKLGIRGSEICYTSPQANGFAHDKLVELRDIELGRPAKAPPTTVLSLLHGTQAYEKYAKDAKKEKTWRNFDAPAVRLLLEHFKPGKLLTAISPTEAQDWMEHLRKKGYNDTSRRMLRAHASAFFNYLTKVRVLPENPFRHVPKPEEEGGGRALTDHELKVIFENAPEALWRTATFDINTGPRLEEIFLLQWPWIDRSSRTWYGTIAPELRKTSRKIKKPLVFPINTAARAAMGPPKASGYVFPWAPRTVQDQLLAIRTEQKLADDITFHCFRHTFATRYLEGGGREADLLETGLWNDYRSLQRYVHISKETLGKRFEKVLKYKKCPLGAHQSKKTRGRQPPGS